MIVISILSGSSNAFNEKAMWQVPLLLSNIIKYTQDEDDKQRIRVTSQKLEASLSEY